ncbi:MAG: hypothetical protein Q8S41_06285 [Lutibacter sp.]|nr:hypothetical protein [Lutibacter sp.]
MMILEIAKWTLITFGIFFICVGGIMLIRPKTAREILRKAGSTNFINYAEISLRMIPAIALIIFSDYSRYSEFFKLFGWFMLITSFVLYFVPRKLHHHFSNKCADILKPIYFQLISPFSIIIGIMIIKSVICNT